MHHHALTVDVIDFQVRQLGAPGSGGVEGREQDALAGSARCTEELRDFFPAQNRRQVMCLFRIKSIGNTPGSAQRLGNAVLPNVALPCPAIFLSETTPPDIRERVEDLSDPGNS